MPDRIDDLTVRIQGVEQKVDKLSTKIDDLSSSVDQRFAQVDQRFEQMDQRFEQVDRRFEGIEAALVEQREYTEFAYSRLDARMDAGFARVERKLDQFIDAQVQTNRLVERRLART